MFRILSTAALLVSLGTGCATVPAAILLADALDGNGDDYSYEDDYVDTGYYLQESNLTGQMRGALPLTGSFEREVTHGVLWDSGSYVDFEIHATDGDWAMLAGGFDMDTVEEGEWTVIPDDRQWVLGCTGESEGAVEYDIPAEQVSVLREEVTVDGEPMLELTIVATFADGDEVTAVVVQPQPGGED